METKLDNNKRNPFARKLSFPLGAIGVSEGAEHALDATDIVTGVTRHARGDWGEIEGELWKENDLGVHRDGRLISEYTAKNGTLFWVVTEADRSATTVLLPEEF